MLKGSWKTIGKCPNKTDKYPLGKYSYWLGRPSSNRRQGRKSSGSKKKPWQFPSLSLKQRVCVYFFFVKNRISIGKFYENTQRLFFYFFSIKKNTFSQTQTDATVRLIRLFKLFCFFKFRIHQMLCLFNLRNRKIPQFLSFFRLVLKLYIIHCLSSISLIPLPNKSRQIFFSLALLPRIHYSSSLLVLGS